MRPRTAAILPSPKLRSLVGNAPNEEVVAFSQPRPGMSFDRADVDCHLPAQISPYNRPAVIYVLDLLPTWATGKV